MTFTKSKKNVRQRGNTTHGWGAMKKHRGKGNKGGAGRAGTGKRGDAKKPSYWKTEKFGKDGFIRRKNMKKDITINLSDIPKKIEAFLKEKIAIDNKDNIEINLTKTGYTKLLATGKIDKKYVITIKSASASAIEKVEEKGGKVITEKKAEKTKERSGSE